MTTLPAHPPGPLTDICQACNGELSQEWDAGAGMYRRWCEVCTPQSEYCPPALPDSGARSEFLTGAVRDASTGKGWPSEIPPCFIRRVAVRYEDGGTKYNRGNWRLGIPLSRYVDAIFRHTLDASEGQTNEDHLGAVGFNAAGFMWTLEEINAGILPQSLNDLPYYKTA